MLYMIFQPIKTCNKKTGYVNFDGFLWVVNAYYYSMFYIARALLENEGIKIKSDLSVHAIAFDAMINFFYLNGKLQKRLIEDFADAKEEASELLGKQKADQLIEDYFCAVLHNSIVALATPHHIF